MLMYPRIYGEFVVEEKNSETRGDSVAHTHLSTPAMASQLTRTITSSLLVDEVEAGVVVFCLECHRMRLMAADEDGQ